MNKQSIVATREGMMDTLSYMAGAGILSGGVMSAWNALSRHLERKKQEKSQKNMIVIELPAERMGKTSEVEESVPNTKISVPRVKKEGTTHRDIKLTYNAQRRSTDGQFGDSMAKAAVPAPSLKDPWSRAGYAAGSVLGGAGAFVGGYALMTTLYNRLKEKRLEEESDTYRQKYMKTLIEKGAGLISDVGQIAGNAADFTWDVAKSGLGAVKVTADTMAAGGRSLDDLRNRNLDPLSASMAVAGVLASLGLGTSAFLTKKYLDSQLGDKIKPLDSVTRRKRIVFRAAKPAPVVADTRPDTEPAPFEEGSEKTSQDLFLSALAVELVKQSQGADYFLTDHVKTALHSQGFAEDVLYKAASSDVSPLELDCLDNTSIQGMLVQNVLASDPCIVELHKMANDKSAGTLGDLKEMANDLVTFGYMAPEQTAAPVNPLQGAAVSETPSLAEKDDVMMPELSTSEFIVSADNPQVARFLAKNKAAISKRLKVPRPRRKKEVSNASHQSIPAASDGDGTRVPEGRVEEPPKED